MRTIRETVSSGISTLDELKDALQTAIQLEFSTLPPYMCAEWSINASLDPSGVAAMINAVAAQEMLHFGLACNMLSAIGGSPSIANEDFVPTYPCLGLPGGCQPGLLMDLLPLGLQALNIFMQIEFPEQDIIATDPDSIGSFYDTIAEGFKKVKPAFSPFNQVAIAGIQTSLTLDPLTGILSVDDAVKAINEIKDQGEGTSKSPYEGGPDRTFLSHYYTFGQIYFGRKLIAVDDGYQYTGEQVVMPESYSFQVSSEQADQQASFVDTFSTLLTQLEGCWTTGGNIQTAIKTMKSLKPIGQALIQAGVRPQFKFAAAKAAAA